VQSDGFRLATKTRFSPCIDSMILVTTNGSTRYCHAAGHSSVRYSNGEGTGTIDFAKNIIMDSLSYPLSIQGS